MAFEAVVYELDNLSGHDFEEAVATLFERLDYVVERTPMSGDEGRDLILRKNGETVVVECKHRRGSIGRPVLQKLQGAVLTQASAKKGIVVTSGSFSRPALEYVRESARAGVELELWDYGKLVAVSKDVMVFFTTSRSGTSMVFQTPWREGSMVEKEVWRRHVSGLASAPRRLDEAVRVEYIDRDLIPAIAVDYRVDKRFSSATYDLYHAHSEGRRLIPLEGGIVSRSELEFWEKGRFTKTCTTKDGDEPVETLFGVDLHPYRERVATEVARKLSKTVHYRGKNNQSYSKYCEVRPNDVKVEAKQVLLPREQVTMDVGPMHYAITVTGDAERPWVVLTTDGFDHGPEGFVAGKGYVCNDCGLVAPAVSKRRGVACTGCGRTLCADHNWRFPKKAPRKWSPLCSECYQRADAKAELLARQPSVVRSYGWMAAASLVPGLPFALGRRFLPALVLALLLILVLASSQHPALSPETPRLAGTLVLLGGSSALYWSWRVRSHEQNIAVIEGYAPSWPDEHEPLAEGGRISGLDRNAE